MNCWTASSLVPSVSVGQILAALDDAYDGDTEIHERAAHLLDEGSLPEESEMWENARIPDTSSIGALIAARIRQKYQVKNPEARYWALRTSEKERGDVEKRTTQQSLLHGPRNGRYKRL